MRSGRYRALFGMAASERLDWVVRVGDAVTVGGNWLALREYHFDGPAPAAGPHARRIGLDGAGIARETLEARDQGTEPRELLEAVLTEMLSLGGYEGCEPALTYLLAYV